MPTQRRGHGNRISFGRGEARREMVMRVRWVAVVVAMGVLGWAGVTWPGKIVGVAPDRDHAHAEPWACHPDLAADRDHAHAEPWACHPDLAADGEHAHAEPWACHPDLAAGEKNLVANGDFEKGMGTPVGWQTVDGLTSFWVKDEDPAH